MKLFQRSGCAIAVSVFLNDDDQNWNDMSLKILYVNAMLLIYKQINSCEICQ